MVNPFVRIHNAKWVLPVSSLSAVLGFMFVVSWLTKENQNSIYSLMSPGEKGGYSESVIDLIKYQDLQKEVDSLRKRATGLEKALAKNNGSSGALNEQLQDAKMFAGLTELEGPGIKVTLRDNPKSGVVGVVDDLIHDVDILAVTNELFASGAEAISINGLRLVATSSIRCAGPTILVDGQRKAVPFEILAIGKQDVLYGGFTTPGSIMSNIANSNPAMIRVTKENKIRVPAFLGVTSFKAAEVPKVSPK